MTQDNIPNSSGTFPLSPGQLDKLTPAEVMNLPAAAIVDALGGASCDIRVANLAKKITDDAHIGTLMPQLIEVKNGRADWSKRADFDCDGSVEHHELLASLIRAAQIAKKEGVRLDQVKLDDLKTDDIQPISKELLGHAPQSCSGKGFSR